MWKSSKDRLIDFLQAQLTREREYAKELQQASFDNLARHTQESAEQAQLLAEAVSLCNELVKLIPDQPAASSPSKPQPPRTVRDLCKDLSERSYRRAVAKDPTKKKLVADFPLTGAHVPTGT